jgi:hypothetical protein
MAFSDPQSLTINAVAVSLPRTGFSTDKGTFSSGDGTVTLAISHQNGRRKRHTARTDHSKIASDPFVPNVNQQVGMSAYLVVDTPTNGYSVEEAADVADALVAYLTPATIRRILGGEI